ncbi:hypothetical protein A0H81_12012 [Grifola frondosa]|uniref:Uncharacterized protein n=1 Tax=Grifola frondosa TaxID=5627 RepID=A0A1C7LTV1_GRIFR|nr:hypothetical protein A0H81_12012 [Grifola frondosa]
MSGPPSAPGPSKGSARFTLNAGFQAKVPTNASNAIARTTQSLPKWDPFASLQSSGSTPACTLPHRRALPLPLPPPTLPILTLPPSRSKKHV